MRVSAALAYLLVFSADAQTIASLKPAAPLDATSAIIDAFQTHDIVALGEGSHGNEQGHAFRLSLIRDPRFSQVANDIVVESGNALYQDVIDQFVGGKDVPYEELRRVWQDTAVANSVWDAPIYEEFFRAVRAINASLPSNRQLRVLLGDPPIDWRRIENREDWLPFLNQRDSYPAGLIEREVLQKKRRALVVYGDGHFMRKNIFWTLSNRAMAEERFARPVNSLVVKLESAGARIFSVHTNTRTDLTTVQPGIAEWNAPALALIKGTLLERHSPWESYIMVDREKGLEEKVRADPERSPTMAEQYNAILYLGPPSSITMSKPSASLCADPDYMRMRKQRAELVALPAMVAKAGAELEVYCTGLVQVGPIEPR